MLIEQINQVEQRIKNLQSSMNAEMDSLLSQLQHLNELADTAKSEEVKRSEPSNDPHVNVISGLWKHIPKVLRVKDVQDILKIGRTYDLVGSGQFYCVKIGRRT